MTITYTTDKPIPVQRVRDLLNETSWAVNRNMDDITTMMANSLNVGAWDGDMLVGYARVLTDGVYRALIEDVIVSEAYRGQGIGRGLIEAILAQIDTEQVVLFCDPVNEAFYEKFGFERVGASAMHIWRGATD